MKENKLTSYNFLSALTENGKDLFNSVYIPICKRAMSSYSNKGQEFGADTDIQEEIKELYGLNVPITIVRQLIKASVKSFTRKEKKETSVEIFENGKNFKLKLFVFTRYEKVYNQLSKDSELLQKAFATYYCDCLEDKQEDADIPLFVDFIDKNKNKLSHFFAGEELNGVDVEKSFLPHVQFIEHVQINSRFLYELIENIYFGSIIAGFLESGIELNAKFLSGEEYYIDTQIILRALDLQNESDTQPAKELIDLIVKLQGKPKFLGITLSEISHILEVAIENYNKNTPTSTVNEACLRLGKNKSWLIGFNNNIKENIEKLGLEFETIPKNKIEKYKKSKDIRELQGTRKKTANAEHDVLAYLHVRDKRDTLVRSYQKAKFWFVSGNKNLYQFNILKNPAGVTSEVILPDTLTSLLWLKGNKQLDKTIKKVGLSELMLQTFHEEIVSKELINDFHSAVIENTSIEDDDYEVLLSSVAHQSAKKVQKFIELVDENKERFNEKVHQTIAKERARKKKEGKEKQETIESLQKEKLERHNAENRLAKIEKELKENSEKNSSLIGELQNQLESQNLEIDSQKSQMKKFKRNIFILLISLIGLVFVSISIDNWSQVKIILTSIAGLGGLWGFINLLISLYKLTKE
ncbi:MAG: hypothetical protein ACOCWG_03835 [bacterium]